MTADTLPATHRHPATTVSIPETRKALEQRSEMYAAPHGLGREEHRPITVREQAEHIPTSPAGERPAPRSVQLDEIARDLREYERATELTREQYVAQIDASAARARSATLDSVLARTRDSGAAFDTALARVYRDPMQAQSAFATLAKEMGVTQAVRTLRERPEALGALRSVDRRIFGINFSSESQARAAAPAAASVAREWAEHTRTFREAAAVARANRLENSFDRALEELYTDPRAARSTFDRLALERGATETAHSIRARPNALGELLPTVQRDRAKADSLVAATTELGAAALEARSSARRADPRGPAWQLEAEPAASRVAARSAAQREATVRAKIGGLARGREELARVLSAGLSRLAPSEVQQLRAMVTAPQLAIATRLRHAARDLVLGKGEGRER